MATTARSEYKIVELFVSEYEDGAWKDASLSFPDQVFDGGIDGLAERDDGAVLALEHTLIQPFIGDVNDEKDMLPELSEIENDKSLSVPDKWIRLFIPVGTLRFRKPAHRKIIVNSIAEWLRTCRLCLPLGDSEHRCPIRGVGGRPDINVILTVNVVSLEGEGQVSVGRRQVSNTLGVVVEKALRRKTPKLAKAPATKRILLLERNHMNLLPERIPKEIERCRELIPELASIHEVWIVEKIPIFQKGDRDARFELRERGKLVRTFAFHNGKLISKSENGQPMRIA